MSYNPSVAATAKVLRPSTLQIVNGTYDIAAEQNTLRQQNNNQLVLLCDLTLNTATSVEIKVQVASQAGDAVPEAADWFDLAYSGSPSVAAAVATFPMASAVYQMTATGKLAIPIPTCYKWIRALAKTTGAVGSTTLAITATQGMA
jgi:hypothetical protein